MDFNGLQNLAGLFGLIGLAWLLSEDRKALNWRWTLSAVLIQIVLALAPQKKKDDLALGMKAWVAGNLATGMTGAVVGLIL